MKLRADTAGTLRFSVFAIDGERQCLTGPAGELKLRPKVFEVLRYLARNAGRAVDKDELLEVVWAGVTVTEESLTQCVSEIRRALGSEHRGLIKTVSKRGYRFDGKLLATKAADHDQASRHAQPPSVAVLPFANLSADQVPAYFSDGLTEDVTAALSKWRWLRVIASNSTHFYKGAGIDLQVVAAELRVRYVVMGSVRVHRRLLRITTQVIEASSRQQIWSNRFDGTMSNFFELSDQITRSLAGAIDPALRNIEIRHSLFKPTESLDAWDYYLQACSEFHRYKKPAMARARTLLEKALKIDPRIAPAHARLAGAHGFEAILGWSNDYRSSLDAAHEAASTAISLDELDALGHVGLARASLWKGYHDGALVAAGTSIELNPNCHEAFSLRGQCLTFGGRPLDAVEPFDHAIELSPRDPLAWATHGLKSLALFLTDQFSDAIQETDRALTLRSRYSVARLVRAASLAKLRRREEALGELRMVSSGALANFKSRWPFRYEADRTKVLRALARIST